MEVDDTGSLFVVGSEFHDNDEDGLDLDDVREITLVSVISTGNGFDDPEDPGSGLQIEAEDFDDTDSDTESVLIIASEFSGNAADGIQISEPEDDRRVLHVDLRSVVVSNNGESGLDIDISGDLVTSAVVSVDNSEDDVIMTG